MGKKAVNCRQDICAFWFLSGPLVSTATVREVFSNDIIGLGYSDGAKCRRFGFVRALSHVNNKKQFY